MSQPWGEYRPQTITVELIRALAKAAPPTRPREIRDKPAGLILRHQPSGYLGLYANLGRNKRERICDARRIADPRSSWTLAKARVDAGRLRVERAGGRDFAAEREAQRAIPTLKGYLEGIYGPWVVQNRRSGQATLDRITACFVDDYGATRISELTPAKVEPWRARRQRADVTAETINRDIVALRGALTRAVKLEVISENPLRGIERAEVDRHKRVVRALTATEKGKLISALAARDAKKRTQRASANRWRKARGRPLLPAIGRYADLLTPAVITSIETGLRRSELFALEWSAIDLDEKERAIRVHGPTAKSFQSRDVPLSELAHETMLDWWRQLGKPKKGPAFSLRGEPVANLKRSYHAVLAAAGIKRVNAKGERVNWHSLRHTFGSILGAANVDATTLMKLMGHANLETTQRYLHTDEKRKRAAVDLLSGVPK